MSYFLQLTFAGLMTGAIYSLLALGFVLIYKSSGIFNFAQGELLLIGTYLGWVVATVFHLPIWLSFLVTLGFAFLLGMLIERFALRPMIGQSILAAIMMTIGLSYFLSGAAVAAFGNYPQVSFEPWLPAESIRLGTVAMSAEHIITFVIAMAFVGILTLFFQRTRLGLSMRATADDQDAARSLGIRVTRVFAYSWAIAAMAAAIGGVFLGSINGVNFYLSAYGLKVFPVVILGGLDSIVGAIVGGLIIGMIELLGTGYLDSIIAPGFGAMLPFILLIFILIIKPFGIFGLARIERV